LGLFIYKMKKRSFIGILKEKDLVVKHQNIYHAQDAFLVNALLNLCSQSDNTDFVKRILELINKHLKGEIKISFKGDIITIEELD